MGDDVAKARLLFFKLRQELNDQEPIRKEPGAMMTVPREVRVELVAAGEILSAEVERLKRTRTFLREENDGWDKMHRLIARERDELRAQLAELRKETQ